MFDIYKLKYIVNAETSKVGVYGYFGNTLDALRKAIEQGKTNFNVIYAQLDFVLDEKYERRFGNRYGTFSLFYPLDDKVNVNRY